MGHGSRSDWSGCRSCRGPTPFKQCVKSSDARAAIASTVGTNRLGWGPRRPNGQRQGQRERLPWLPQLRYHTPVDWPCQLGKVWVQIARLTASFVILIAISSHILPMLPGHLRRNPPVEIAELLLHTLISHKIGIRAPEAAD